MHGTGGKHGEGVAVDDEEGGRSDGEGGEIWLMAREEASRLWRASLGSPSQISVRNSTHFPSLVTVCCSIFASSGLRSLNPTRQKQGLRARQACCRAAQSTAQCALQSLPEPSRLALAHSPSSALDSRMPPTTRGRAVAGLAARKTVPGWGHPVAVIGRMGRANRLSIDVTSRRGSIRGPPPVRCAAPFGAGRATSVRAARSICAGHWPRLFA